MDRQIVQTRGRVTRQANGKLTAVIYFTDPQGVEYFAIDALMAAQFCAGVALVAQATTRQVEELKPLTAAELDLFAADPGGQA